jgi:hypothetical protein
MILIFALVAVLCYVAAARKEDLPAILSGLPWQQLADASVVVVAVAFTYEWYVRKETEAHLVETLVSTPAILQAVLSPEKVDELLRAGLEARLGSELGQAAFDSMVRHIAQYPQVVRNLSQKIVFRLATRHHIRSPSRSRLLADLHQRQL